jgi:hypothetical protein
MTVLLCVFPKKMASLTTTPNANIVNIFPFPNIITSATGSESNAAMTAVATLQTYLNTTTASLSINKMSAYSGSNITSANNLVLSNASLYINNTSIWTAKAMGIGTIRPVATLDVVGTAYIHSTLSVSSSIYASSPMFAPAFTVASDGRLKRDVIPYTNTKYVEPVRFAWTKTGVPDIGVIAQDVWNVEPACVHSTSAGTLTVDYAKLVVLCLAELRDLRSTVQGMRTP